MGTREQNEIRKKYYNEAIRYMDNAKETLKKAGKYDNMYKDKKYVKTACGTAYNGVLVAIEGLFILKGIKPAKNRESKKYYTDGLSKINTRYNSMYESIYSTLHLSGYYEGILNAPIITAGFNAAYEFIETIKPTKN